MSDLFEQMRLKFKSAFGENPEKQKEEPINKFSPPGVEVKADTGGRFDTDGKFFRLWGWALPLLLGLAAGWFVMVCLEIWLEGRNARSRPALTAVSFTPSIQYDDADKMAVFLRANPFGVTPMPIPDFTPDYIPHVQTASSMASATLTGTSPSHMAWIRYNGRLRLILVGANFDDYTLVEVTPIDATFINGEHVVKNLIFSNRPTAYHSLAQRVFEVIPPAPTSGAVGYISMELVNNMLENPFDELREIRFSPADNQGLQVEWITGDSIFAQLGVQQGDVIRSINGIVFHNVIDVTNSLNSLMYSDQFVIEVMRNNTPTLLQHAVR